jgi:anti-anti-sigma factor
MMTSTLRLDHSTDEDIHTVTAAGCLDEAGCGELARCLDDCGEPGARVLLDLRGLDFMDTAGLQLLERAYAQAALEGWTFAVMTTGERYIARARAA